MITFSSYYFDSFRKPALFLRILDGIFRIQIKNNQIGYFSSNNADIGTGPFIKPFPDFGLSWQSALKSSNSGLKHLDEIVPFLDGVKEQLL